LLVDVVKSVVVPSYKKLQICSGRCEECRNRKTRPKPRRGPEVGRTYHVWSCGLSVSR
jgi:hypothetical protein